MVTDCYHVCEAVRDRQQVGRLTDKQVDRWRGSLPTYLCGCFFNQAKNNRQCRCERLVFKYGKTRYPIITLGCAIRSTLFTHDESLPSHHPIVQTAGVVVVDGRYIGSSRQVGKYVGTLARMGNKYRSSFCRKDVNTE